MEKVAYKPGPATGARSPLAGWFGGKYYQAKKIIPLIPEHHCYVEPFCGAARVYFKKNPSPCEVLNDINGDLVNVWNQLLKDPDYFLRRLDYCLASRKVFEEMRDMTADEIAKLSPAEQAWRVFYILRLAHIGRHVCEATWRNKKLAEQAGQKQARPVFAVKKYDNKVSAYPEYAPEGTVTKKPSRLFAVEEWQGVIKKAWERMSKTSLAVEHLPFEKCIAMYDRPETFFYLDPPYATYLKAYGDGFSMDDLERLAEILAGIKGRFILSMNNSPETRKMFAMFQQHLLPVCYASYNAKVDRRKKDQELLVANYDLDRKVCEKYGIARP